MWATTVFCLKLVVTMRNPPNKDGTQVLGTEDLNVANNSVLPQTEAGQGEGTSNEVDIHLCDKGDSTQNGDEIQLPDKGEDFQKWDKEDLNIHEISKEESMLRIDEIRRQWNLPEMTVSITDIHAHIKKNWQRKASLLNLRLQWNQMVQTKQRLLNIVTLIFAKLSQLEA